MRRLFLFLNIFLIFGLFFAWDLNAKITSGKFKGFEGIHLCLNEGENKNLEYLTIYRFNLGDGSYWDYKINNYDVCISEKKYPKLYNELGNHTFGTKIYKSRAYNIFKKYDFIYNFNFKASVVLEMVAKVIDPKYSDSGQHTTTFNYSHKTRLNLNDRKALDKLYKHVFTSTIDRCKSLNKTFIDGVCTITSIRFTDLNNESNNKSIVNKEGFKLSASLFNLLNENAVQIAELPNTESTELPDKSSEEKRKIEEEKRKIEEEKRKIEEEKKKIAEAKKKQEEEERKRKEANAKLYVIGSGTGFFVSSAGHAVSNEHVVGICKKVATKIEGEKVFFNILKTDKVNDIGLIKGDYKSSSFLNIKSDGAEFGEDIVAFGYPLSDKLSSSVKLSRGIVSSLSGPNDNYSEIQIDAAIQPGNSGGPVLNMEGQVVGIASSGLNKVLMLLDEDQPYIPENINFAVAAPTLLNFLKSNGVTTKSEALVINNTKELAKIGRPATIQLFCLNTKAKYEELKKKKKHNNVLLEKVVELN